MINGSFIRKYSVLRFLSKFKIKRIISNRNQSRNIFNMKKKAGDQIRGEIKKFQDFGSQQKDYILQLIFNMIHFPLKYSPSAPTQRMFQAEVSLQDAQFLVNSRTLVSLRSLRSHFVKIPDFLAKIN